MLLEDRSVVLEEGGWVVVDVLNNHGQGGRGGLGGNTVVYRQDFHLKQEGIRAGLDKTKKIIQPIDLIVKAL